MRRPDLRIGRHIGRRRVLALCAFAAAALPGRFGWSEVPATRWQGQAFGADVSLTIRDADTARAQRALDDAAAEIVRLEQTLSLYREDSALVQLNREGQLAAPPAALRDVLNAAAEVSRISDGAFDVTVQPLWDLYLRLALDPRALDAAVDGVRGRIDWRGVRVTRERIAFDRPGMAVTLNGIAQGYAADVIAGRLRRYGFAHVLADLGEFRGLGGRALGDPWRIGIDWPQPGMPGPAAIVDLVDQGVATSSPFGTRFDADGSRHHLFDPHTGRSAANWASVSVVAPTAMTADALSTAMAVAPRDAAATILARGSGSEAILIDFDGRLTRLRA